MEEENKVLDATSSNEEVVLEEETTEDTEDVQALRQKLAEAEEARRQLTARAKAAEAKLKEVKPAETQLNSGLSKEEAELIILAAQGYKPEQLDELKALAKVRNKSLIETQNDPIFVKMKEQWEAESKAEKARLGASRGSGTVKKDKDFNTPGLSDEDFKALWKSKQG